MKAAGQAEVFVAGGGMVGLTSAIALAQGGLAVALADPLRRARITSAGFDGRVSAINYSSARMYRALGIWQHLEPHAEPIRDILVTDAGLGRPASPFSLHFDHGEAGEPLGYMVENRYVRAGLLAAADALSKLHIFWGAQAMDFAAAPEAATVRLGNGREFLAKLIVAADGRDSQLRDAAGIDTVSWEYDQHGIVTVVSHELPHNGVAYEHFQPSGPFAILPMQNNRSALVWTEKSEFFLALMALGPVEFTAEVVRRFGAHLGAIEAGGPRWSYPLRFHLAREYVRPRLALVGDCAHGIHPIAGQGLNLGLKDAAALAETVLDRARLGLDFGELEALRRYERWRRFDNFVLAAATDALNRLFSNDVRPVRAARDLGLGIVDRIGPLRRFFMRQAGGETGKLPRLLRGEAA
ncbi:MAG: FAD-dependent monooxygenase [Alphaproteobacteria bacterium]